MAKTYAEKLRDPRWQRRRLEIMQRDEFRCRHCDSEADTLNVHHTVYARGRDPWDYDGVHLLTLCEGCHEAAETVRNRLLALVGVSGPEGQRFVLEVAQAALALRTGHEWMPADSDSFVRLLASISAVVMETARQEAEAK